MFVMKFLFFLLLFQNNLYEKENRGIGIANDFYSDGQICDYPIRLPAKINWKIVDNRVLCKWCENRYAKNRIKSSDDIIYSKYFNSHFYLQYNLQEHYKEVNADEEHMNFDNEREKLYLKSLYGEIERLDYKILELFFNGAAGQKAFWGLVGFAEIFAKATGIGVMDPKSSLERIGKYENTSEYCSNECETKAEYYRKK